MKPIPIILILFASSLHAGEVRLKLQEVSDYTATHNRDLKAAAFRIEEACGRLTQAGRLANPELGFEHRRSVNTSGSSTEITLAQKFPLTARLRLEKAVSRAQLAAAEAEFQEEKRQILLKAKTGAVKWLAVQDRRAINAKQLANSQELTQFLKGRVSAGEAPATDATLVELETRQLESELLLFDVEAAALAGELRPLLGTPPGDSVVITGQLGAPRLANSTGDPNNRPDLQAARHQAEAARREIALARSNRWEDISVGLIAESGREEDDLGGSQRDHRLGFLVSVPLPLWNRNQGRIQETAAAAQRSQKEVDSLVAKISAEVTATRNELKTLAALIEEFDTKILPSATQLEEQLRASYGTGQTSLIEVLRARDRRLQLERQRSETLRDYHLARVREEAATGRILAGTNRTSHPGK